MPQCNEAILEAVEAGVVKNVSFMAVGPEIEHAVELLGGRDDICYGAHLTLNAEWEVVRWKPLNLTRYGHTAPIVDARGYFLPTPSMTKQCLDAEIKEKERWTRFDVAQDIWSSVYSELEMQVTVLQGLGLELSYVDEHMGFSSVGLKGSKYFTSLIDGCTLPYLPSVEAADSTLTTLERRVRNAMLNTYVWVTHPGKDEPDMQRFYLKGGEPGVVARERDAERQLLCSPELKGLFARFNVRPVRYDQVLKPK